jgi:hypothetical protein
MAKLLVLLILAAVAMPFLTITISNAATTTFTDITAQGSDNTAIPALPVSFDATLVTNFHSTCNWTAGFGATGYVIYAKFTTAPSTPGDGYLVDNTTLLSCDDFGIDLSITDEPLYYSVWSYNSIGYSATYLSDYVQGGTGMSTALSNLGSIFLFLGITGLGAFLIGFAWWSRVGAVAIAAAVLWMVMGCYSVATGIISGYALNTTLGIIMVLLAFVAAFLPVLWRRPTLPQEEEGYTSIGDERDELGGEQPQDELRRRDRQESSRISKRQLDMEYNSHRARDQRKREALSGE